MQQQQYQHFKFTAEPSLYSPPGTLPAAVPQCHGISHLDFSAGQEPTHESLPAGLQAAPCLTCGTILGL